MTLNHAVSKIQGLDCREGVSRVIFLDFDGTLGVRGFEAQTIGAIEDICKSVGAKIVIASGWAWSAPEKPDACFENAFKAIPSLKPYRHEDWRCARFKESLAVDYNVTGRRLEILEWLGRHHEVTRWAALDDYPTPEPGGIDCKGGATLAHILQAGRLLRGDPMPAVERMDVDYAGFPPNVDLRPTQQTKE